MQLSCSALCYHKPQRYKLLLLTQAARTVKAPIGYCYEENKLLGLGSCAAIHYYKSMQEPAMWTAHGRIESSKCFPTHLSSALFNPQTQVKKLLWTLGLSHKHFCTSQGLSAFPAMSLKVVPSQGPTDKLLLPIWHGQTQPTAPLHILSIELCLRSL